MRESAIEEAVLCWFRELGYSCASGTAINSDGGTPERSGSDEIILAGRLQEALRRINPHLEPDTLEGVARMLLHPESPSLEDTNLTFQRHLMWGVDVQVRAGANLRGDKAWLFDFSRPDNNDWLVVSRLRVQEERVIFTPDLVVYINGLPLAVIELKNLSLPSVSLREAYAQLDNARRTIPALFRTNELLVVSDGIEARVGSLTTGFERFSPWRTVDGTTLSPADTAGLEVLLRGLFDRRRLLEFIRHFVLWKTEGGLVKTIASYHQFYAVNKAIEQTLRASREKGDKRIGVVWHTQGAGKSISMVFYTARLLLHPEMSNPTVVVLTDRNDLHRQLFSQFYAARELLPPPVQAESREHLKELIRERSGGLVFTTIQKFGTSRGERFPLLSDRHNIVVIADEAHRSQYDFIKGFARNLRDGLPNASFIGFTGTPLDFDDKSTPAVFGDYIDIYPIDQAVEDKATVPLYYEARQLLLALPENRRLHFETNIEEVTEGEEALLKSSLTTRWARVETLVGAEDRIRLLAEDIVQHWQRRQEVLDGKAMIVAMSRRICVALYRELIRIRPEWHSDKDEDGALKVIMTGAADDPEEFQPHIRNKTRIAELARRFKDPEDPLKLVIVRDMWLTDLDVPCAHTLYLDRWMKGHVLMQAIARVNRVFKNKPSGLIVDYTGLTQALQEAMQDYGAVVREHPGIPMEEAFQTLQNNFGVVQALFHGFDYQGYFEPDAPQRLAALAGGVDYICGLIEGKTRFFTAMDALNRAIGTAIHLDEARPLRKEIDYFQAVQTHLSKYIVRASNGTDGELNLDVQQTINRAIESVETFDIFSLAGLKHANISILSDEFLETLQTSPYRNLQVELLKKLLQDELHTLQKQNLILAQRFSDMLEQTLLKRQNRSLETPQALQALVLLAREMRNSPLRGQELGLSQDELAFYDALSLHGNVRNLIGDMELVGITRDLVQTIRSSVTIDWLQKESVRADMRRKLKRLLRKHDYPHDRLESAVATVIEQAEVLCKDWAEAS
ncbi:type I restriction endonuclease subunit R [Corallococcus sp. CA054B]|nr:type I restriction endonuclease subunit R [Corallococcus sp. CA054B]